MADEKREELEIEKPLMLFGRDVRKIPCFRDSYLYGICSGIGAGLVVFMFTSKPRWASHAAVGTFGIVTTSYWFFCRKRWAEDTFALGQIKGVSNKMLIMDGADKENKVPKEIEVVDV